MGIQHSSEKNSVPEHLSISPHLQQQKKLIKGADFLLTPVFSVWVIWSNDVFFKHLYFYLLRQAVFVYHFLH